jgi:hypothetical protein
MDLEIQRLKVVIFPDGRLDTDNSARFLGLSAKTLAMMRRRGPGQSSSSAAGSFTSSRICKRGWLSSRGYTALRRLVC